MPNNIRTPKLGVTATSRRIAQAVDNEQWQIFRVGLKGHSTHWKLDMLRMYHHNTPHKDAHDFISNEIDIKDCDICIRVDNYIKALCRGGQLGSKESLATAIQVSFKLEVIK